MSIQNLQSQMQYKNYIPPMTERQIGWKIYAEQMPIDVCGTEAMRKGWLSAWRAEGHAVTSQVWCEASEVTA